MLHLHTFNKYHIMK